MLMRRKNLEYRLAVAESALNRIAAELEQIQPSSLSTEGALRRIVEMDIAIGSWRRGLVTK
jgi:hypothetical protein